MRRCITSFVAVAAVLLVATVATAQGPVVVRAQNHNPFTLEVTITNLTANQILSPPIVVVHDPSIHLFSPGEAASDALAAEAEDADDGMLLTMLDGLMGSKVDDVAKAAGPLPPGQSVTLQVKAGRLTHALSAVAMLVTTNDGFMGLDAVSLFDVAAAGNPFFARPATLYASAWDAGSEANTEFCADIPGPPCGHPGVRNTADAEGFVHVHRGIHGTGDLAPALYDWRNPVAKITVKRMY